MPRTRESLTSNSWNWKSIARWNTWSLCQHNKQRSKFFGFANIVAKSLGGNGIVETRTPLSRVQGSRWGLEESKLVEAMHQSGHTPPRSQPAPLFWKWKGPSTPTTACSFAVKSGRQQQVLKNLRYSWWSILLPSNNAFMPVSISLGWERKINQ